MNLSFARNNRSQMLYKIGVPKNFPKSHENTSVGFSFLIKLQAPPATLQKNKLQDRYFPVNFANFLKISFL